jgi:hypothetical protein
VKQTEHKKIEFDFISAKLLASDRLRVTAVLNISSVLIKPTHGLLTELRQLQSLDL